MHGSKRGAKPGDARARKRGDISERRRFRPNRHHRPSKPAVPEAGRVGLRYTYIEQIIIRGAQSQRTNLYLL